MKWVKWVKWVSEWVSEVKWSKKVLWFSWNFAHLKFPINKCAEFSKIVTSQFLIMKKIDFCVEISGILAQNHGRWEAFFGNFWFKNTGGERPFFMNLSLKTQARRGLFFMKLGFSEISFKGISFVNFTPRHFWDLQEFSLKGFLCKIDSPPPHPNPHTHTHTISHTPHPQLPKTPVWIKIINA